MQSFLNAVSQGVAEFEVFCLNFTKGVSCNISLIRQLIENEEEEPKRPAQDTTPSAVTELARRRAENKKKQGAEEESPKKRETKTVRGTLWWMIKWNFFFSALLMMGMTQVFTPALSWIIGDVLKKNQVLEMMVSRLVMITWMIPIVMLSKVSNTFWMNDLSSLAYKKTMGKPVTTGLAFLISDLVYTIIMQLFFFIQVSASAWIPFRIRHINLLELALSAIMYSMYAFEYKWMNMGFGVRKRLDLIDRNFGYHFGFGFPLAFTILYFENFWIGVTLNSVFFPALILCANNATEPRDIRGRTTYVFYPTEKVVANFFHLVHKFGLGNTVTAVLVLAVVGVLFWLGVLAALCSWLGFLLDSLPVGVWVEKFWLIWNSTLYS